jgi:hypothetical protein
MQQQIKNIIDAASTGSITPSQATNQSTVIANKSKRVADKINKKYAAEIPKSTNVFLACNSLGYQFKTSTYRNFVGYAKCDQIYSGDQLNKCKASVFDTNRNN